MDPSARLPSNPAARPAASGDRVCPAPKRKRDPAPRSDHHRDPARSGHSAGRPGARADPDDDHLVPSVFTWNYGGQEVYITGAWDNWATKTPMYKNGSEYIALIYVPCGEYQFKYYVDENWQCAPNLPTRTDEHGNTNNVVKIVPGEPEFDSSAPLNDDGPPSPISTYNQNSTAEFSTDPPALPPHLEARSLKPLPDDISPSIAASAPQRSAPHDGSPFGPAPQGSAPHDGSPFGPARPGHRPFSSHVYIDHLYQAQVAVEDDDVQSLSQTTRVGNRVITTVFITTRSRRDGTHPDGNGYGHPT